MWIYYSNYFFDNYVIHEHARQSKPLIAKSQHCYEEEGPGSYEWDGP